MAWHPSEYRRSWRTISARHRRVNVERDAIEDALDDALLPSDPTGRGHAQRQ